MIPNEIRGAAAPGPEDPPENASHSGARGSSGLSVRLVLMILAVILAGAGLLALIIILGGAWLQAPVWPGWVLLAYACLPLGFLLMALVVLTGVLARRRS